MIRLNFRDRLLAELTELIPAETERSTPTLPATVASPRPGRRRLLLAAAAAALAAIGGALIFPVLDGATGSTPAWAIERSETGEVLVTVHEVDDPVRLQEDLRAAGVPAVVRAGSPTCGGWVESEPGLADVLREDVRRGGDDHFWRINPRALQPGHFLAFLITRYPATDTPDGNGPFVSRAITYSFIIAATDNPPCTPLPHWSNGPSLAPTPNG